MLKWLRKQRTTPPPYMTTQLYRRRTVDLLGRQMVEFNAIRDSLLRARADGVRATGVVLSTVWQLQEKALTVPFAEPLENDPGDTLVLTVTLETRA